MIHENLLRSKNELMLLRTTVIKKHTNPFNGETETDNAHITNCLSSKRERICVWVLNAHLSLPEAAYLDNELCGLHGSLFLNRLCHFFDPPLTLHKTATG